MKRYILLLVTALCMNVFAQQSCPPRRFTPKDYQAKEKEFLTKFAELTEEEAAKFFPTYQEMQKKMREINRVAREKIRTARKEAMDDEDYLQMIDAMTDAKLRCAELRKEYIEEMKKILPAQKLMRIQIAEERFQREILKNMHKRGEMKDAKKSRKSRGEDRK